MNKFEFTDEELKSLQNGIFQYINFTLNGGESKRCCNLLDKLTKQKDFINGDDNGKT